MYLWLDRVYLNAVLEKENAAWLVTIGVQRLATGGAGGELLLPGVDGVVERPTARVEGARHE